MEIERYEPKEETKIMKALDQVFDRTHNVTEEDALLGKDLNKAVDNVNCIMIEALSERGKRIISRYVDRERLVKKPALDYSKETGNTNISIDFITKCIKILEIDQDYINIIVGKDKPIIIKNKDFEIIIAPSIKAD